MSNIPPLVSVVIPAFNAQNTIGITIESVLSQTFGALELAICDDASTDCTSEVVRSFSDSRIRLISNQNNMGEGLTRDRAIDSSIGQWIAFLDADDVWAPNRLEVLLSVAKLHPDAVIFDEIMECHDTPHGLKQWRRVRAKSVFPYADTPRQIDFNDWITWQRTMIQPFLPSRLIREHQVRHTTKKYSADLEYLLTLLGRSRAPLWYVPHAMYLYRLTGGSMSTVPDRYSLLVETLDGALDLFADVPSAQAAIRRKADVVRNAEKYHVFFSHLMHGHVFQATKIALKNPGMILEFARRSMTSVPYHLSRWWYGGARRRTV